MKVLIVVTMVALLAFGGFVLVNAMQSEEVASEVGYPGCSGGCSSEDACSSPSCGVKIGSSCGCRR